MLSPTRTDFRVRYPEVDRMGVAHHAAYLIWFELGRTELMRAAGLPYGALEDVDGVLFPVVEAAARFRAPARYDEELAVETRIEELDRLRVRFAYRILRNDDQSLLAEGHTVHVAANRAGRPRRVPQSIFDALRTATGV